MRKKGYRRERQRKEDVTAGKLQISFFAKMNLTGLIPPRKVIYNHFSLLQPVLMAILTEY